MILDKQTLFSEAQAVTAAAASDNIIDLGSARDIGVGEELAILAQVAAAFTDGGSDSTLAVTLETDSDPAFGTKVTLATLGTFAALSPIGTRIVSKLQPGLAYKRYIRLYYTPANGNLTTGSITAGIVKDAQLNSVYPSGFTVS